MKTTFLVVLALASCTVHPFNSPVEVHRPVAAACPASPGDSMGPDLCLSDADCPSGQACACAGTTFENYGSETRNMCVIANCHVDADCGAGVPCSPSNGGCGNTRDGVVEFDCRTSEDTCGADIDCGIQNGRLGSCSFSPEFDHWACTWFAGCAG